MSCPAEQRLASKLQRIAAHRIDTTGWSDKQFDRFVPASLPVRQVYRKRVVKQFVVYCTLHHIPISINYNLYPRLVPVCAYLLLRILVFGLRTPYQILRTLLELRRIRKHMERRIVARKLVVGKKMNYQDRDYHHLKPKKLFKNGEGRRQNQLLLHEDRHVGWHMLTKDYSLMKDRTLDEVIVLVASWCGIWTKAKRLDSLYGRIRKNPPSRFFATLSGLNVVIE